MKNLLNECVSFTGTNLSLGSYDDLSLVKNAAIPVNVDGKFEIMFAELALAIE